MNILLGKRKKAAREQLKGNEYEDFLEWKNAGTFVAKEEIIAVQTTRGKEPRAYDEYLLYKNDARAKKQADRNPQKELKKNANCEKY